MRFPTGLRALNHRDFRLFIAGQLISLIGTWMQSVGQAWLVLELTGSPFHLGLVTALQFTPILLFSPVGGALSDRFPKRRIILLTQAAMMGQAFVLAALVWSGQVRYWHVAVLAAIYGLGRAIDIPARQSYITDLVGRGDLANAVALNSLVFNGARIVGPAAAGLLIARFGVALAFLLLIGVTLLADGLGQHVSKGYVYFAMGFSVFVESLNLRAARKRAAAPVRLRQTIVG